MGNPAGLLTSPVFNEGVSRQDQGVPDQASSRPTDRGTPAGKREPATHLFQLILLRCACGVMPKLDLYTLEK